MLEVQISNQPSKNSHQDKMGRIKPPAAKKKHEPFAANSFTTEEANLELIFSNTEALSQLDFLAAFALFVHRQSGHNELSLAIEGRQMKSKIDLSMSFTEFKDGIQFSEESPLQTDISLRIDPDGALFVSMAKGPRNHLLYVPEFAEASLIDQWKGHFRIICCEINRNQEFHVQKLCLLSPQEKELILEKWNATTWAFPNQKMLHQIIEEQVQKSPLAEAVRFNGEGITYETLNRRANQLAHRLRSEGVGPDTLVAICLERSIDLVIGLLGILKSGGAYVPLDPSYPLDRLSYILSDSQAKALITDRILDQRFTQSSIKSLYLDQEETFKGYNEENPNCLNSSKDLCYAIYTSGSTGKPKGVGNIHQGVVNRILWMQDKYRLIESDRILQKTPFSFDVSVWEFFWPLMVGATLVMAQPEIHKDAEALANLIEEERITTIHFVPSMLNLFLEAQISKKCGSLKRVFTSGEALPSEYQNRFFEQFNAELHNLYGPTEASIDVTYWPCVRNNNKTTVPIGYPIANTQIYILDEFLQPVPIGVPGELFIGGVGLARGYINRDALTQEKFIHHPFRENERLYRSGDLCRFLPDGAIEYLSRIDHQIKLRGFRIELGEIQSLICQYQGVKDSVVIAREDVSGQKYLAAYVIAEQQNDNFKQLLASFLQTSLPEYMVPSAFVFLEKFPLNPNGKLDSKQLPNPKIQDFNSKRDYLAPRNGLEKSLQKIWGEILGFEKISIQDNFFSIGGHSLQAMRLVLKIKQRLHKKMALPDVFLHPTIEKQALLLDDRHDVVKDDAKLIVAPQARFEPFELTDIQRAYFLGRTDAFAFGNTCAHIYVENEREDLDIERLEQALNHLILRHDMLRCVVLEDGTQQVLSKVPYYKIQVSNLRPEQVRELMEQTPRKSQQWPLFEVRCTRLPSNKTVIHFYFELLIADGTGLEVIFKELSQLYKSLNTNLPSLDLSYRDSIITMGKEDYDLENAKQYWFQRIDRLPEAPELPRRSSQEDLFPPFIRRKGGLTSSEWKKLQDRASQMGVTVAALLATLYGELLKTWSKSAHFTLNLMFFNRPPLHPQIDHVVGNFSTTLLLEMDLRGLSSLETKVKKVQEQLLKDLENSSFNGIKVLNELNRRRGGTIAAAMPVVFACALNLHSHNSAEPFLFKWYGSDVSYSRLETPQVLFDHQVFEDHDGSFCFFWDVRENYFPEGMIEQMFLMYQKMLQTAAAGGNPLLNKLPSKDRSLIEQVNNTGTPFTPGFLHSKMFEQAKINPSKPAVITTHKTLSYGQLAATALTLSQKLESLHCRPNDLIAIVMEKGWEQIVAVFAIQVAGAGYLPIDAALPEDRIKQILTLSGCRAVIAQRSLPYETDLPVFYIEHVEQEKAVFNLPPIRQKPTDLAYVIFTSGSTGVPKGVMIEHQAALNTIETINQKYQVTCDDRAFAISSLSFDLSVYDIFGLLSIGGSLYIPTGEEVKNPQLWLKAISKNRITLWNSAPALMQVFMDQVDLEPLEQSDLRLVMMSGDWIPVPLPDHIRRHFKADVFSLGGATEAAIWSCDYPIQKVGASWTSIPYGKPLLNQKMVVLDEDLEPRALWVPGKIYIGGIGLARGYFNDREKTAHQFIVHHGTGERLYCTGDYGRLHQDGNIEFLGREDLQVKVQGYRIELEEIENTISQFPEIQRAVVRILGSKNEAKQIIAFFMAKNQIDPTLLKLYMEKKLPFYMVPNRFVQIETFPLNSNGKVDLKALTNLANIDVNEGKNEYVEPQGEQELKMAQIWEELLKVDRVGRTDNFFNLGGTSFIAFQMIHQVKKKLDITLSPASLFQKGSIGALLEEQTSKEDASLVALHSKGAGTPLFFVHPSGGGVLCYTELSQLMDGGRPFYGFQSPGYLEDRPLITTVQDMARHYLKILLGKQPNGPHLLGGWSFGGVVAYEMAIQLQALGHKTYPLLLVDSPAPLTKEKATEEQMRLWFEEDYGDSLAPMDRKTQETLFRVFKNNIEALIAYQPPKAQVDIVSMKATKVTLDHLKLHPAKNELDWGWSNFALGTVTCHSLETDHGGILQQPYINSLAEKITEHLP